MREHVAVRVPRLVVAQVDLNEVDPSLDEPAGHQERPAERMAAVSVEHFRVGVEDVERVLDLHVGQERDGGLSMSVERLVRRPSIERGTLVVDAFSNDIRPESRVRENPAGKPRLGA